MEKERKLRKPKATLNEVSTSEEGLRKNYTRATFIIRKDILFKIKSIAFKEGKSIKYIINKMLIECIKQYEESGVIDSNKREVSKGSNSIEDDPFVKYYKSLIEKNKNK